MSRLATQTLNALKRAGITDPMNCTLAELLRVKGLGPLGIHYLAQMHYPPPGPNYFKK